MRLLQERISSQCRDHRVEQACRVEIPLAEGICPFLWLSAQTISRQNLWSCRNRLDIRAGVGAAQILTAHGVNDAAAVFEQAGERLSAFSCPDVRFFGGFAFQEGSADEPPWPAFGGGQFWMPRFECIRDEAGARLVCNLLPGDHEDDLLREVDALCEPRSGVELSGLVGRQDWPDREGWYHNIACALEQIASGELEKIVLARKAVYQFVHPEAAARILAVLRSVTSNCFHFLLQPDEHAAFMGTPPECLFRRTGDSLQTEALAGTRPRAADPETDAALSRELLESEKEAREHGIVRTSVLRRLTALTTHLQADEEPELLKLERKQHLISRISASLLPGVSNAQLLKALHPTPAVGGMPREKALEWIQTLEPFARGWYAAPVGWVGVDACEFAVAIRSGLVAGNEVSVYSGAGIVQGSDPEAEWQEIENKISDFVKVTQGAPR